MALTKACLRSLNYPQSDDFDITSPAHIQSLILWLENTKIRQYPVDGRAQLQAPNSAEWHKAFEQYLSDIGCPVPFDTEANTPAIIDWLLSHAGKELIV